METEIDTTAAAHEALATAATKYRNGVAASRETLASEALRELKQAVQVSVSERAPKRIDLNVRFDPDKQAAACEAVQAATEAVQAAEFIVERLRTIPAQTHRVAIEVEVSGSSRVLNTSDVIAALIAAADADIQSIPEYDISATTTGDRAAQAARDVLVKDILEAAASPVRAALDKLNETVSRRFKATGAFSKEAS